MTLLNPNDTELALGSLELRINYDPVEGARSVLVAFDVLRFTELTAAEFAAAEIRAAVTGTSWMLKSCRWTTGRPAGS